jgi:NlpC/P60 family putative phage cell wall peptidase
MLSRREAIVVAQSWLGTPYVKGARVRGAGCDCATLLAEYLIGIGAAEREDLGVYSHDWFCHATEERYMFALMRHAAKTLETVARGSQSAKPGDLVLFRVAGSRVFNHGGIVTQWPKMIHAVMPQVRTTDATLHPMTSHTEMVIFDPFATDLVQNKEKNVRR